MKNIKQFPKEWLKKYNETELERLGIMTVDGGLTDEEAEKWVRDHPIINSNASNRAKFKR